MTGYWTRILRYAWDRSRLSASDEHLWFPGIALPPAPGSFPLAETRQALFQGWSDRLADTRTRAFRVIRNGTVTGSWDAPGDSPDRMGRLYSVTKSVLSLAWGLADSEGRVPPLDEPVFRGLTPRNLLRMDSGIGFDEGFASVNRQVLTYLHPDSRKTARRARLNDPVAGDFHYNDFHSLLLGVLLEEGQERSGWRPSGAVAEPVAAWIWERLLVPLGMAQPGRFVVDSEAHRFPKTESGLCLSAETLGRIGLLVLEGGRWQGSRLVPETWVRQSTDPTLGWFGSAPFRRYRNLAWGPWLSQGRGFYGWHWWGRRETGDADTVFAMGIHGQLIVISPKHRAVVVRLADRWALKGWWPDVILKGLDSGEL